MLPVPGWSVLSSDPEQRDGEEQASLALPGQETCLSFWKARARAEIFRSAPTPERLGCKRDGREKVTKGALVEGKDEHDVHQHIFISHTNVRLCRKNVYTGLFSHLKGNFLFVGGVFAMNDPPT